MRQRPRRQTTTRNSCSENGDAGVGSGQGPSQARGRKRNPRGTEQVGVHATSDQRNTSYNVAVTIYTHLTGQSSTGECQVRAPLRAGGGLAGRSLWRVVRLGLHSRQLAGAVRGTCSSSRITCPHPVPCDRPTPPVPGSSRRLASACGIRRARQPQRLE